jgi:hypothetical protein
MAMLLRMFASFEVSRMRKRRWWFASQKLELMQRNLLKDSVATARRVVFYQGVSSRYRTDETTDLELVWSAAYAD